MSQENVEIVRAAFDAFAQDDIEGVLGLCHENIVITQPPELPDASPEQRGHSGVLEAFEIWPKQWDDYRIEILRMADHGDRVLVSTRQRGRGKQSGIQVEMEIMFVFTVRDAKIVEMKIFMREEQALEAAGLRE
jgi:ketosteroid isomerase-like protein